MFLVTIMRSSLDLEVNGVKEKLPLQWEKGMIGVVPVFKTEEEANAYAAGRGQVVPMGEKK